MSACSRSACASYPHGNAASPQRFHRPSPARLAARRAVGGGRQAPARGARGARAIDVGAAGAALGAAQLAGAVSGGPGRGAGGGAGQAKFGVISVARAARHRLAVPQRRLERFRNDRGGALRGANEGARGEENGMHRLLWELPRSPLGVPAPREGNSSPGRMCRLTRGPRPPRTGPRPAAALQAGCGGCARDVRGCNHSCGAEESRRGQAGATAAGPAGHAGEANRPGALAALNTRLLEAGAGAPARRRAWSKEHKLYRCSGIQGRGVAI